MPYYAAADEYLGRNEAPDSRCLTSVSWPGQVAGTTVTLTLVTVTATQKQISQQVNHMA